MLKSTNFWVLFFSGVVFAAVMYLLLFSEAAVNGSGGMDSRESADIQARMAKYAVVQLAPDLSGLTAKEREVVKLLIEAAKTADEVFWKQASPDAVALRDKLSKSSNPADAIVYKFLVANYGPYDRLDDNKPFYVHDAKPLGAGFYPSDLTRQEFENYVKSHPKEKEALTSPYTVVKWKNDENLEAVPYSTAYAAENKKIIDLLRKAAGLIDNPSFKAYLTAKADDFAKNNFYKSDTLWLKVKDSKLDLVIGPTEVYEDALFNYKAAYEAFVMLKDEEASRKLEIYNEHRTNLEGNLPVPADYKKEYAGLSSPLAITQLIYIGGDSNSGAKTIAFNLPNDEKVREETGSKKMLLKNVLDAKFDKILVPIADILMDPGLKKYISREAFSTNVLMHEFSHAFGLNYTVKDPKLTVKAALGHQYSAIEECKADVLGLFNQSYFAEKGIINDQQLKEYYATFIASIFRSVRFGAADAHGVANMIQFNYLQENGAIKFNPESGKYDIDFDKIGNGIREISHMILTIQGDGDAAAADNLIKKYGVMSSELKKNLESLKDLPVDIIFEFKYDL
jgi:hypothetical protein